MLVENLDNGANVAARAGIGSLWSNSGHDDEPAGSDPLSIARRELGADLIERSLHRVVIQLFEFSDS